MKLLTTLALALGLATANLSTADACGFIPPEHAVQVALADQIGDDAWKKLHAVTFLEDGRAQVELRWNARDGRAIAQYHWFILDERFQWQPDGTSYTFTVWVDDRSADAKAPRPKKQRLKLATKTSSTPAVAAR